jgi:hypothetical protein
MSMSKGGWVPQFRWSSVCRAASDRTVAAIAKPETPFVRVDLGVQISGNAWRVFHLDKKAGFEREISFGGFEHLAVPLRLLGKDEVCRNDRICRQRKCQKSGRERIP